MYVTQKELLSDLEVPWSNTAALSTPYFLQQGTRRQQLYCPSWEDYFNSYASCVGFVASCSAKEVECCSDNVGMVLHEFKLSTASETCVDSHTIKLFTILCCLIFLLDQICYYSSLSNQNTSHNSWLLILDFEILVEITEDYWRIQEIAREY